MFHRRIPIGDRDRNTLPRADLANESRGQREPHTQGAGGGHPEQAFVTSNRLAGSNVASRNDAIEWGGDLGFLQLKFQRTLHALRVDQKLFDSFYIPLVTLSFVARVLKLFLWDEFGLPHFLGPLEVGVEDFCLSLPIIKIGLGAGGFGASRFQVSRNLAIIQFGQQLSFTHPGTGFNQNFNDHAFSLGRDVDLVLDHDWTRSHVTTL